MAKEAGMSVPSFCKKKAQGARMRAPKINRQDAFEMCRQLRAIVKNVNQISRRVNDGQAISNEELQSIQKELQTLWQQFRMLCNSSFEIACPSFTRLLNWFTLFPIARNWRDISNAPCRLIFGARILAPCAFFLQKEGT